MRRESRPAWPRRGWACGSGSASRLPCRGSSSWPSRQRAGRDDPCPGPLPWLARLRRARGRLLARVRPERQGRHHGAPAPGPRGRAGAARPADHTGLATRSRRHGAAPRPAAARLATGHPSWLSHRHDRPLHAGADPPGGSRPPQPGAFLPRRDRGTPRPGVSYRAAGRRSGRPDRAASAPLALARLPGPALHPPGTTLKMIRPGSLLRRSFLGLNANGNDRNWLSVEAPAGNGVGTARAIARAYSAFAEGGAELGITRETFARHILGHDG